MKKRPDRAEERKRAAGRPPKPPGAKQSEHVLVRLTPAEMSQIDDERGELPRAEYVRLRALGRL